MPAQVHGIHEKYGNRLIIAVGRLVYYKGFEYLLQAMRNVDAKLLLIGSGLSRKELESAIEKLGVAHKAYCLALSKTLYLTISRP